MCALVCERAQRFADRHDGMTLPGADHAVATTPRSVPLLPGMAPLCAAPEGP
jgi:hypothetical protein